MPEQVQRSARTCHARGNVCPPLLPGLPLVVFCRHDFRYSCDRSDYKQQCIRVTNSDGVYVYIIVCVFVRACVRVYACMHVSCACVCMYVCMYIICIEMWSLFHPQNYLTTEGYTCQDMLQFCLVKLDSGEYHCSGLYYHTLQPMGSTLHTNLSLNFLQLLHVHVSVFC